MKGTSIDLDTRLQSGRPWASLLVMSESEVDNSIRALPQTKNRTIRIVRGYRCITKEQLFREWAAALQFPSYFGENWDAFEDCLLDRDWLPGDTHVVCITSVDVLLQEKNKLTETFWNVLRNAAENSQGAVLRVILQTQPKNEARTRKALDKLGIRV
jgi:RNAse (barnase) inhibitor barstar